MNRIQHSATADGWASGRAFPLRILLPSARLKSTNIVYADGFLLLLFSVMPIVGAPLAWSAGQSCDAAIPKNFEKLSLDKKVKVTEVIRECERKLKASNTKDSASIQKDGPAFAYITARADRPTY